MSASSLSILLQAMIESHRDCGSRSARVRVRFDLLIRRPALVTEVLSEWKSYPVCVTARQVGRLTTFQAQVGVSILRPAPARRRCRDT
ncbi:MAG: hypothetical protein CBARDMAM_6120 [uncultured Caballeronia sp.]|nr:MAG: hypothetical protein CBARDMAM_6120 [uncultured Caballeronia sp.]